MRIESGILKQKELQDENRNEDEATTGVARPRKTDNHVGNMMSYESKNKLEN